MTDLTPFEQRLSERLSRELGPAIGTFDPAGIAASAIARRSAREELLNHLRLGPLPLRPATRFALVGAVVVLLAATIALAALATRGPSGRLAFIRLNGELVVATPQGSDPAVISHLPTPGLFTQLEWAPNGRHLAISNDQLELKILTPMGEVASTTPIEHGISYFEWSPDGQLLAILDGPLLQGQNERCGPPLVHPHLDVLSPDGSHLATPDLPSGLRYTAGIGELKWSPDGRRIAITGSTDKCTPDDTIPSSIWLIDLEHGAVRELTPGADKFDFQPAWLPDGRLLFSRSETGLMQVDPDTGTTSVVLDLADACPSCADGLVRIEDVSPDGTRLLLKHSEVGPLVLDLNTNTVTAVEPEREGAGGIASYAWSPDGTAMLIDYALTFEASPSIVAVDVATGAMREIAPDTRFFAVLD